MAAAVSSADVARLLAEPSAERRAELATKLSADLSGHTLTQAEMKLGQEIVRLLARDVEQSVRACLSRGLRHSPNLPPDVARKLAQDVECVALPMLADSLVLTDEVLIEIVRHGSCLKQEAIACRRDLSEPVTGALIEHGAEPAVVVLMGNTTAAIADDKLNHAVTRFAGSNRVREAMVLRGKLPASVAERLVTLVSGALQAHLAEVHDLAPATVADIVLKAREHEILRLSLGACDGDLREMVAHMHCFGRLTPSLITRAVCTGDIAFFEAAMAARSNISVVNAQLLIHEASGKGLEALYRKAEMPAALYGAVRAAIERC